MAKYKLIIVDDEFLVVKGLKETVDWAALDVEVVATCSDGRQGLQAVRLYKPDLVISDIRMPVCDGLTLAETLEREHADCAVIIYSGFSDFDYVSKAMEHGVTRYLLKPIENSTLMEKVKEVLSQLEQTRENRKAVEQYKMGLPLLKQTLITKLLEGADAGEAETDLKKIGVIPPKRGIVIECAPLPPAQDASLNRAFNELSEALESFGSVAVNYGDRFVIVTALEDAEAIYDRVKSLLDGMKGEGGPLLTAGISAPYGRGKTLQQAYAQAKRLREKILFPTVNNIAADEESSPSGKKSKLVADALNIITQRYGSKLSVSDVAGSLYVSESHLMHEFKETLGKTFNECLTEYRMTKARQTLDAGGGLRIKEIAALVGYSDVKYFSTLFKEFAGVSPAEYAEREGKR